MFESTERYNSDTFEEIKYDLISYKKHALHFIVLAFLGVMLYVSWRSGDNIFYHSSFTCMLVLWLAFISVYIKMPGQIKKRAIAMMLENYKSDSYVLRITFDENNITIYNQNTQGTMHYSYDMIANISQTKNYYILATKTGQRIIVSKSFNSTPENSDFIEFLKGRNTAIHWQKSMSGRNRFRLSIIYSIVIAGILIFGAIGMAYGCENNSDIDLVADGTDIVDDVAKNNVEATADDNEEKVLSETTKQDNESAEGMKDKIKDSTKDNIEETMSNSETDNEKSDNVWEELEIKEPLITPSEADEISIEYSKTEHTITMLNNGEPIATYSAGSGRVKGDKEQEGDLRTPEGEFYICVLNENSQYHLAFGLSYPDIEDAERGLKAGLISQEEHDDIVSAISEGGKPNWYTALGGEIMIHGQKGEQGGESDWTSGCIAVDNEVMDIMWPYVQEGTKVTIRP